MAIEPLNDDAFQLADGRTLAWDEYGDAGGTALFWFHGLPGSRRLGAMLDSAARAAGLRVISPDRPGFGKSTYDGQRRFESWPDDVRQLADHLAVDRFHVSGISGGGVYTLATAHQLGDRVLSAGVISGGGDISTPEALEGMHANNRAIFELAVLGPEAVATAMAPMLQMIEAGIEPDPAESGLPAADIELLKNRPEFGEILKADGREALAAGVEGAAYEAWLFVQPWAFDVSEIKRPVVLWHGDDDRNAPLSHAQALADKMPDAELVVWTGMGHLTAFERLDEILQKLIAVAD